MGTIYISPDVYCGTLEEELNLQKFDFTTHWMAGLHFFDKDDCLILASIDFSTPSAQSPHWRNCIRGAWLIEIDGTPVSTIGDTHIIFCCLSNTNSHSCTLLFSHPKTVPDISNKGLPIMSKSNFSQYTHDQLNNQLDLLEDGLCILHTRNYDIIESGHVQNYITRVMQLMHGKLLKQEDWSNWQQSEYLQLDQYDAQGMSSNPIAVEQDDTIFLLVWTYSIKALDGCKKAHCVCNGSTHSGMGAVKVLDKTYANCVAQTSSRLFYAVLAGKNLLVFGADVSITFAKAPPPKQGFYIRPNKAFHDWWVKHKGRPPIPPSHVIPALSAMQGHPESPRLWEKHANAILRDLDLTPTVHEPCLYSQTINGNRIIFKCQVDNFALAVPDEKTANILLDMIDDHLTIP
jgi:hypothetical protein